MHNDFSICVFCASSNKVSAAYMDVASNLGKMAAQNQWRVVYGGAHLGLMGRVADAALAGGGEVIGFIPEHLKDREIAHEGITQLHITQTMHERQKNMADAADGFVILPGGLGTLAEFFEIVTWKQLGLHQKPIAVINTDGYWTPLIDMIKNGMDERFIRAGDSDLFSVFDDIRDLPEFFAQNAQ